MWTVDAIKVNNILRNNYGFKILLDSEMQGVLDRHLLEKYSPLNSFEVFLRNDSEYRIISDFKELVDIKYTDGIEGFYSDKELNLPDEKHSIKGYSFRHFYIVVISEESKILLSCLDYRVSSSKYNKFSNNVLSRTSNYKSFYIQEKGVLLEANNSSRLLYDCTYLMKNNMYKLNEKNNTLEFITDMSRSIFDIINLVPVKAYIAKLMLFS